MGNMDGTNDFKKEIEKRKIIKPIYGNTIVEVDFIKFWIRMDNLFGYEIDIKEAIELYVKIMGEENE